jgi:glycosyltransferase involved in cell wall biosynthesis
MNNGMAALSPHRYPEVMPTGFCFMFRRNLTEEVGMFDEAYVNYGEESHFWMSVITHIKKEGEFPRYRAVLADDTYVFHERGSSFASLGHEKHMSHRSTGGSRFNQVWPQYKGWRKENKLEENIQYLKYPIPPSVFDGNYKYNVAFVVHSSSFCGGMKFITDIVNEMIERGINAKVVQIWRNPNQKTPEQLGELRTGVVHFKSKESFLENFQNDVFSEGLVFAATSELAAPVYELSKTNTKLIPVLFSQSYDPELSANEAEREAMVQSYNYMPHIISNAKWLDSLIKKTYNRQTLGYVSPGIDRDLFHPRGRESGDERPTAAFMVRTDAPYRGYERAVVAANELNTLAKKVNFDLRILAIGVDSITDCSFITCLGALTQARMATLLGTEIDVFCDPCHLHSYGMPSLEAMASGAVPILWDNCGIHEYAENNKNAIILDRDAAPKDIALNIFNTLYDEKKLKKLKRKIPKTGEDRKIAVNSFIEKIEGYFKVGLSKRRIAVITPHLRKWGGPTTIVQTANTLASLGHDVTLHTVYPDISPSVLNDIKVPLSTKWQKEFDGYDVIITNSDGDKNPVFHSSKATKKVLLKLSHNERFKELERGSLLLKWDAILTSTDWLADVCKNPVDGWEHPTHDAKVVGWYHYEHPRFQLSPSNRHYFTNNVANIATLIHAHPLKGSGQAFDALKDIKEKYGNKVHIIGFGEDPTFNPPPWMQYVRNPRRDELASLFKQCDILLSASHTEGLGRIALEAMSASMVVVKTDTGAQFAKDGENCLLVDIGNVEMMKAGIEHVMNDIELFKKLAVNGYKTACEYADSNQFRQSWAQAIEDLFND